MKKQIIILSSILAMLLTGCSYDMKVVNDTKRIPVTLNVTTTWAGTDGGSATYQKYIQKYMEETGCNINDSSGGADETFKQRVLMDFEVGGEPDVLFYFSGSDADTFIKAEKVIPIEMIQEKYPEYASNLEKSAFTPSKIDNKMYAVPVYGYWEALYVNKKVCEKAGVEIPGKDTTWDEFLEICAKIDRAGYTPIAASLAKEPHYWFEFIVYNQMSPKTQGQIPTSMEEESGQAWMAGLTDLKDLYERGYFSSNTLYTSADECFQSFLDGKAAFLVDGSWKMGTIIQKAKNVDDFSVTYVPGKGNRKGSDMIGGFSSGWYITRKAWEDPDKQRAAVEFVSYMTSDEVISDFATAGLSTTALKDRKMIDDGNLCQLQKDAAWMLENSTSMVTAVQDNLSVKCRYPLFMGMPDIVTGKVSVEDALRKFLNLREEEAQQAVELLN